MNGIPMKLDYSKTLNDQHETFEYYKNRYINYELQIIQLNKRIAYLERSIERKEETITELELERVPYTNEYIKKVKQENNELKKQFKHCYCNRTDCSSRIKDSKKYDSLQQENEKLKKQLEYLRSGEYYNQIRFENKMLQDVVDNGKVSKEDREFIDCTHRNTELLEQQKEFIDCLEDMLDDDNDIFSVIRVKDVLNKYLETIGTDIRVGSEGGNKDE